MQFGKLPTLIGAEYAFTFQNMNIERGLLWNQEPIISRGIQGNYASGPLTVSLSLNDGFYSNNYNWISGLVSYALNKENTIAVAGGGSFQKMAKSTFVTPLVQNNSRIINLIYTYNAEPWTITPYFQYTDVPSSATLGIPACRPMAAPCWRTTRSPIISTSPGAPSTSAYQRIRQCPVRSGSSAGSLTLTPTYQNGIWFLRGEGLGRAGLRQHRASPSARAAAHKTQVRGLIEGGIVF